MGGFSVKCDCGKWFEYRNAYKDHCKAKGCEYDDTRVGSFSSKTKENNGQSK